jgi:ATP/maltotriose-dependent transcriptional regulator MalT
MHEALNDENWRRLERWLSVLPENIRQRPGILAAQVAIDQIRYKVDSVKAAVDKAQAGLLERGLDYTPAQSQQWQGMLDSYKSLLFAATATPQMTMQLTAKALDLLPADALYVRSLTEFWQIYALQMSGQPQAAANLASDLLQNQVDISPVRGNRLLLALSSVYWGEADVTNLRNTALVYRRFAERTGQLLSIGWSAFLLGWCQYQNNELEAAERSFAVVKENLEVVHVRTAVDSLIGMALIQKARHRDEEAQQTLAELREFLIARENVNFLPLVETLAWRLGLGDQSSLHTTRPFTPAMIQGQLAADLWELPVLTRARADIESLAQDRLAAAEYVLHESRAFAESRNSRRILLRIGALQTLLHLTRDEMEKGMACLQETVLLGEPGGALREILDMAPALYRQLEHLREQGVASDYLGRMLAAYKPGTTFALMQFFEVGSAAGSDVDEALATVLTYREIEVLLLVEQRLSNQQIAQKLYLSPHTVKKHTVNIYRKLDVKNRREAVVRARAAGLLPEH